MSDLQVMLTRDEIAFVLNELYSQGHGHDSSQDDFEAECPSCTAADKLADALKAPSCPNRPSGEGGELSDAQCDAIYQALHNWAMDIDQYDFGLPQFSGGGVVGGRDVIRKALASLPSSPKEQP